ncbi:Ig-like domain-containing protein [Idiomarina aminovorans]|uniref:Ig-like domain-containing protein n=1 Tax=Idiomarina aminovorans TaxID=2914829 RepID=UPI0020061164|nr:Ig-like domain-containing protein [Idiomarina sp. ATCH4]MCK7458846.1 cadherin-like domain-containing protein [Idiomarina sp. ATCH4]
MRTFKYSLLTSSILLLTACGGSNSDNGIATEKVSANLAEDSQWQSEVLFNSTAIVINDASNGSLSVSDQTVTYTPAQDFNGADTATVEADNTRYKFEFTVTPVNDAPTVNSSRISIIDSSTYEGELAISDIDGDKVSVNVKTQPNKGTVALGNDGIFTYTLEDLSLPAENFVLSADDGTTKVDITIDLIPAYSSNTEKAAYYYRSQHSHLKAAEQRLQNVSDEVTAQPSFIALANGYLTANLNERSDEIIQQHITSQQGKAEAFKELARTYDRFGKSSQAHEHRVSSFEQQRSYIADNGLNNLRPDDSQFLLGLINDFNDAKDSEGVAQVTSFMDTLVDQLGGIDKPYSTEFGFLVTSYRNNADSLLERYFENRTQANFDAAFNAAANVSSSVRQTGYQEESSGEFEGKMKYQLAPLYGSLAIEYFFMLGEFEAAKDMLAWTLSYYTNADYDPQYSYSAKPNAAFSLQEYDYPLVESARYFALLYPELENLPIALIPDESWSKNRAQDAAAEAEALALIINNNESADSIAQAIEIIEQTYPDDLRDRQEAFSGRIANVPYTGGILAQLNYQQAAKAMLIEGINLMQTDAYLAEENSRLYTLSTRGCLKYLQYANALTLSEVDAETLNNTIVSACETMTEKGFSQPDGVLVTRADQVAAYTDLADLYQFIGATDNQLSTLQSATTYLSELDLTDDEQAEDFDQLSLRIARAYASASDFSRSLDVLHPVVARWTNAEGPQYPIRDEGNTNQLATVLKQVQTINGDDGSVFERQSITEQLRSHPNLNNFASIYQQLSSDITKLSDELVSRFNTLPASAQVSSAEDVIAALAANRQYAKSDQLAQLDSFGAAEVEILLALISQYQALQDDFPASIIATVDTDHDGLANFYAEKASSDAINDSGILADEDADNDGINDAEDPEPLTPQ